MCRGNFIKPSMHNDQLNENCNGNQMINKCLELLREVDSH